MNCLNQDLQDYGMSRMKMNEAASNKQASQEKETSNEQQATSKNSSTCLLVHLSTFCLNQLSRNEKIL
jgi:hypothetical protein